jgi:hypothetical protein
MLAWSTNVCGFGTKSHGLGTGSFIRSEESAEVLADRLRELRFVLWEIDTGDVFDEDTFFEALYRVMGAPEHWGHNWDAFEEWKSEADKVIPERIALLWHHSDLWAGHSVKLVAEATHMFLEWSYQLRRGGRSQLELFILGDGVPFRRHRGFPCP